MRHEHRKHPIHPLPALRRLLGGPQRDCGGGLVVPGLRALVLSGVTFLDTLPKLTERAWMGQVLTLARMFGWRAYHTYDSRRSAAGFPDLVLVRRPRVIFAELKTDRGRLSDDQRDWLAALSETTVESYVWRPRDLERVTETLR